MPKAFLRANHNSRYPKRQQPKLAAYTSYLARLALRPWDILQANRMLVGHKPSHFDTPAKQAASADGWNIPERPIAQSPRHSNNHIHKRFHSN